MRLMVKMLLLLVPLATGGCLAKTAFNVVTAPVKVASQTADWATTSQDEADRNYGRKMRKQEAREARDRREAEKRCRHDSRDCDEVDRGR